MALSPPTQFAVSAQYTATITLPDDVTAGHGVIVLVDAYSGPVTSVTGGSDTFTIVQVASDAVYVAYCSASAGGYDSITIAGDGAYSWAVWEIPEAISIGTSVYTGSSSTETAFTSGAATLSQSPSIAVGMAGSSSHIVTVTGVGTWTTKSSGTTNNPAVYGWQAYSATGTSTLSGTLATADYVGAAVIPFYGTGPAPTTSTGAVSLGITTAGTGTVTIPPVTATGSPSLGLTTAGTASLDYPGTASPALGMTVDGQGTVTNPPGTGAISLSMSASAQGTVTIPPVTSTGSPVLGLTTAGTGTVANPVSGAGSIDLGLGTAGTVLAGDAGMGVLALGMGVSAEGTVANGVSGTGAIALGMATSGNQLAPAGTMYQWDGTAWVPFQWGTDGIYAGAITADLIAAGTVIAGAVDGTTITGATFEGTNWIENAQGSFLYNGTPAAGNLAAAIAPAAGTDAYGNTYEDGINTYGGQQVGAINSTRTAAVALVDVANIPGVYYDTSSSLAHSTAQPAVVAFADNVGDSNEYQWMVASSGKEGGDDAAIQLHSESYDGTIEAQALVEFGGTVTAAFTPQNTTLTTGGGFSGQPVLSQISVASYSTSSTTPGSITAIWGVPANDAQVGTVYRLKAYGNGTVSTEAVVGIDPAINETTLPNGAGWNSGAVPTGSFDLVMEMTVSVKATGSSGSVDVHLSGSAVPGGRVSAGAAVSFMATNTTYAVDTASAWSVAIFAASGTAGDTTVGTFTSTFERLGP
jgi:hypothetical protein